MEFRACHSYISPEVLRVQFRNAIYVVIRKPVKSKEDLNRDRLNKLRGKAGRWG